MKPRMKLYRYQPINKLTLINLSKQKNWVADPLEFNDPYEFRIRDIYDINSKGNLVYLDNESIELRQHFLRQLERYGVICYSNNDVNQLLWSHYADNHKGMCLVFEIPKEKEKGIKMVRYADTLPKIDFKNDNEEINKGLLEITTTKSKNWSYENEFRQIFFDKGIHVEYPGNLVEIIFGCRCSLNDIKLVFDIVKPDITKITFSKTFIQKNSFLMGISSKPHVEGIPYEIPSYWESTLEM